MVIGVSRDSLESHKEFATHLNLNFPLVADPNGEIAAKYGVKSLEAFGGVFERVTFIIGADGKIAKVFPKVNPRGHADEVLAVLQTM